MINEILHSEDYKKLVEKQVYETIEYLLDNSMEFSITANIGLVEFNPALPTQVSQQLQKFSLFSILRSNYALISFELHDGFVTFETGFGSENFGSVVKIPLHSIFQIVVDESILYINSVATVDKFNENPKEKSMNAFKNNPNNKRFNT